MALSTAKLTELPPHLLHTFSFNRSSQPRFRLVFMKTLASSLGPAKMPRTSTGDFNVQAIPSSHSSWMKKWPSHIPDASKPQAAVASKAKAKVGLNRAEEKPETTRTGTTAIDRIVLRLRNLGLGSDDEEDEVRGAELGISAKNSNGSRIDEFGDEKLGDLLKRDWVRPDTILVENEDYDSEPLLPWERSVNEDGEMDGRVAEKKREMRAPSMAELTIEDDELRRLRRDGMTLRERISVAKAGITGAILEKIHDKWRKSELVRLKFHEELAHDMKTAHEIVERRTGGLVTWRSGSVMVVFRGVNYEGPISKAQRAKIEDDALFVPSIPSIENAVLKTTDGELPALEKSNPVISHRTESITEEETEYNRLLDGLGPRFDDWWGTGVLPVDADLLPPTIPGYKTPFRLLPTGMRSNLTNAEMTNLRKLAKSLPSHFALGRNRNHQGLASSIVKLWEKSLLVKIAVKRGIQNTNNKIMAEELKNLTGGVLLLRNKYYIVMYRGKDFLPPNVASALTERHEMTKQIQDVEEKARRGPATLPVAEEKEAAAGTLAEFYEAQARWKMEISSEEHKKMVEDASRSSSMRAIRRLEHKIALAQAKKLKAEKLLSKIVDSWVPVNPSDDQETITDEERVMYRMVGLRMTPYLPLGIRGVFDGVIENMHLHWKHRELVKLISKEKEISIIEESARLLEYESGGILVAIEKVPKGHSLIYYRGKNYRRPLTLRPRNLLTKAKALKRRVALQRYEALSQHISELEKTIEQAKKEIGNSEDLRNTKLQNNNQFNNALEFNHSEDEDSIMGSDDDEDEDDQDDEDEDDHENDEDEDDELF